jgi:phosphopantetheinyl transferase
MNSIRGASFKSDRSLINKRSDCTQPVRALWRDRRCSSRPKFVEGWRKAVGSSLSQSMRESVGGQNSRIDIWVANTRTLFKAQSCLKILTEDDWISLVRLQDPAARYSAVAARVLLRLALSRAVDRRIAPSDWRFGRTVHDKPIVTNALPNINFSVSHADQLAAVAVSPSLDVGIDIEKVDQKVSEGVIAGFCHADEQCSMRGLPSTQKIREFIRLWTLKEAYSKMIGLGHSLDFKTIKFLLNPINLESSNEIRKPNWPTQFESFYVAADHALFHASLATRCPAQRVISAEVQIISLVDSAGNDGAFVVPLCC